jgi:hypothetical protein
MGEKVTPSTQAINDNSAAMATPKQVRYLQSLLKQAEADLYIEATGDKADADELGRRLCSWYIDYMKEHLAGNKEYARLPRGVRTDPGKQSAGEDPEPKSTSIPDIPAGHYAVQSATGNNDLDFYRVDRPEEGRWAGRTFVKRVIGGHPNQKLWGAQAVQALKQIEKAGVEAARQKYGVEIGQCWRCNRHLTDELSRERGIGPDCYALVYGAAA